MKEIQEFVDAQKLYNVLMDSHIGEIQDDIKALKDQIDALQASSSLSDEDKAGLAVLSDQSKALVARLAALDDLVRPEMPEAPVEDAPAPAVEGEEVVEPAPAV